MFREIIDDLIDELSDISTLSDITFINAFDNSRAKNPITAPRIAVGFGGAEISNGALGNFIGENSQSECFGKQGKFSLSFDILSPIASDGDFCCDIFARLSDALIFEQETLAVTDITCGQISFDEKNTAFSLQCSAEFKLFLSKYKSQSTIQNIVVK